MHTKGYVQSRIQQVIAKIDEQMRRQIFRQNICHLLLGWDIHQFDIIENHLNLVYTDSIRNDSCFNECDGFIQINVTSGGAGNYTFTWQNGVGIGNTASNLCAGNYNVTIEDAIGCDTVLNYTITEPSQIVSSSIQGKFELRK